MPKFIGRTIPGSKRIGDNAMLSAKGDVSATDESVYLSSSVYVRLSYSQAAMLPPGEVLCSLDTTDRGGRNSYAKRWYRWFALASDIITAEHVTDNMLRKAGVQNLAAYRAFEASKAG